MSGMQRAVYVGTTVAMLLGIGMLLMAAAWPVGGC